MELTNREIATLIWLGLAIGTACLNRTLRGGLGAILRILFTRPIRRVLAAALFYVVLCAVLLAQLPVWRPENLKATLIWIMTFGIVTIFEYKRLLEERLFFRNILRETLSAAVVLVFLIESYTLNLWAELMLIPFATLLTLVYAMPPKNPDQRVAHRFVGWLMTLLGLSYLTYSALQAAIDWRNFATLNTTREFAVPILLSLMFLPFLYGLKVYGTYQQVFSGLRMIAIPDRRLRRYAQWRAILAFRFNLNFLKRWRRMMVIQHPASKDAIKASISELRRIRAVESNPPTIAPSEGWSPYDAKDFLATEGLETEDYHSSYDDEWRCASLILKVQEGVFAPTLTYYVTGDERAAAELLLELDVFNCENPTAADERFWRCAALLLRCATSQDTAQEIATTIGESEAAALELNHWWIELVKEDRQSTIGKSYERTFALKIKPADQTDCPTHQAPPEWSAARASAKH
jgi:hypothetical protein